jgi:hypothetical protein
VSAEALAETVSELTGWLVILALSFLLTAVWSRVSKVRRDRAERMVQR